jgi:microcystin-dependent protein
VTTILLKRSATAAAQPNPAALELGELAVNTTDAFLFMKNGAGVVKKIGADLSTYSDTAAVNALIAAAIAAAGGAVPGEVKEWSGVEAPAMYAMAYGQAVSRATYATAFANLTKTVTAVATTGSPILTSLSEDIRGKGLIGAVIEGSGAGSLNISGKTISSLAETTLTMSGNAEANGAVTIVIFPHGRGDGSTTFNLPDRKGRVAIGRDDMGGTVSSPARVTATGTGNPGIDATRLGVAGGVEKHTVSEAQMPQHNHNVTDPGHVHADVGGSSAVGTGTYPAGQASAGYVLAGQVGAVTGITIQNKGGGEAHPNVQPSIVMNFIVYLGA